MIQFRGQFTALQRTLIAAALSISVLAQTSTAQTGDQKESIAKTTAGNWQSGLHRTDLVAHDLIGTNQQVIQVLVDFDAGVAAPKHSHPGVEVAHVIKGTIEYTVEGQKPRVLKAGESLYIPPGLPHVAKNIGKDVSSELATYIVEKGKPLVKPEK
ncbi:cupin domain-containing protein [Caballeronia novacaledonica]|uniref:Cupin domain-containing protein n=1 Tax=Caballeronia novacaledonica TaxID=1544861 RepID=A0AA37IK78_9BURK|nr:cupin domain-containing protein [Caballeronia novacaledonica]GJH30258.1 cupin domain-containing protein [Caballeronia novacaledonica]